MAGEDAAVVWQLLCGRALQRSNKSNKAGGSAQGANDAVLLVAGQKHDAQLVTARAKRPSKRTHRAAAAAAAKKCTDSAASPSDKPCMHGSCTIQACCSPRTRAAPVLSPSTVQLLCEQAKCVAVACSTRPARLPQNAPNTHAHTAPRQATRTHIPVPAMQRGPGAAGGRIRSRQHARHQTSQPAMRPAPAHLNDRHGCRRSRTRARARHSPPPPPPSARAKESPPPAAVPRHSLCHTRTCVHARGRRKQHALKRLQLRLAQTHTTCCCSLVPSTTSS